MSNPPQDLINSQLVTMLSQTTEAILKIRNRQRELEQEVTRLLVDRDREDEKMRMRLKQFVDRRLGVYINGRLNAEELRQQFAQHLKETQIPYVDPEWLEHEMQNLYRRDFFDERDNSFQGLDWYRNGW